jgi:hypothetical protein
MERDKARKIANDWYEAAEEIGAPKDLNNDLQRELCVLLSDEAQTGLGRADDSLVVLALDGGRFLCIGVEPGEDDGHPITSARSIPLDPAPDLEVSGQHTEENNSLYLDRTWTVRSSSGEAIVVVTRVPVSQSFTKDRGGEVLMKAMARKAGWPIPDDQAQ